MTEVVVKSFFTGWMPFLSPNQQCQNTEGKISHAMDLHTPNSPGVFQLCLWPLIAPGYLGEVCHASHQPSDASTPWLTSSLLSSKDYHYYDYHYHYSTPSLLFTQPIFLEITPVLQVRPGPHPIGLNYQCLFLYTDGCLSRHPRNKSLKRSGKAQ